MTTTPYTVAVTATALSGALCAGVFFAFSTFTMRGLDRTAAPVALSAMRGINAEAQTNAPFMVLFFGSALLALAVGVIALTRLGVPGSGYVAAGAALVLVAAIVAIAFNVPLNDHLAALDLTTLAPDEAARQWQSYSSVWTAWNHIRTIAPLVGAGLLATGIVFCR